MAHKLIVEEEVYGDKAVTKLEWSCAKTHGLPSLLTEEEARSDKT